MAPVGHLGHQVVAARCTLRSGSGAILLELLLPVLDREVRDLLGSRASLRGRCTLRSRSIAILLEL